MDLNDLGWVIDQNLKSLKRRVNDELIKGHQGVASSSMLAPTPPPSNVSAEASVEMEQPQWFKDMMASPRFGVGVVDDDDIVLPPFGAASSSVVTLQLPNATAVSVEIQQPQWFKDMMFSYDNNLPPFGDGNPNSSNFNQHFP